VGLPHPARSLQFAVLPDLLDFLGQLRDPVSDMASVGFQLRFTGTAQSDPTALPLELGVDGHEPRKQIGELRQFDLELALAGGSPTREDVENELRPINHAALERFLEVSNLQARQLAVHDDHVRLRLHDVRSEFLDLPLADKRRPDRLIQPLTNVSNRLDSRRLTQAIKFALDVGVQLRLCIDEHQEGTFDRRARDTCTCRSPGRGRQNR